MLLYQDTCREMEVLTGEKGTFSIMDYFMHHQVFRNKSVE